MKSDRKMTENIIERVSAAEAKRKNQKNLAIKTMGGVFAFVLVFVCVFSFFAIPNTPATGESDTVNETVNKSYSLIVANAAEELTEIYRESRVSVPMGGLLYVRDTSKMSGSEINKIADDTKSLLSEIYGETEDWSVTGIEGDTAVYFATCEYFRLNIADADAVENIVLSCGINGKLLIYDISLLGNSKEFHKTIHEGKEVTVTGDEYESYYNNEGMIIRWKPSEELQKALSENPDTSLSEISDEIKGVIRYTDGSEESFTITFGFDDNGILDATYSYNK